MKTSKIRDWPMSSRHVDILGHAIAKADPNRGSTLIDSPGGYVIHSGSDPAEVAINVIQMAAWSDEHDEELWAIHLGYGDTFYTTARSEGELLTQLELVLAKLA